METISSILLRVTPHTNKFTYTNTYICHVLENGITIATFGQSYSTDLYKVACYFSKCLSYIGIKVVHTLDIDSNLDPLQLPGLDLINSTLQEGHTFSLHYEPKCKVKVIHGE